MKNLIDKKKPATLLPAQIFSRVYSFMKELYDFLIFCVRDKKNILGYFLLGLYERKQQLPTNSSSISLFTSCIDNATIFQTDRGYLGIGPLDLRPGDLVCAVDECPLPVLLRRNKHVENEALTFTHIGCCYVLGLSDGEPAEMVRAGKLEIETFKIR